MLRRKTRRTREFDTHGDVLAKLLEREQRTASTLDAARADAERLVHEAREYASRTEASCESMIEERNARLTASYEQQLQLELQRIQSEAAAEASRFAEGDPARTRALVALVLEEIGAVTRQEARAAG
jgi:vacuolar-type H+-ATPase subunit H